MITVLDIKHKPALLLLIAFGVGISASNSLVGDHLLIARVSFLCAILLGTLFFRIHRSHYGYAILLFTLLALTAGILFHSSREASFEHSLLNRLAQCSDKDAAIYGRVTSRIESVSSIISVIDCDSVRIDSILVRCTERLGVQMSRNPTANAPEVGQYVEVSGSLSEIVAARNPYENSYTERLQRKYHIAALIYSHSGYDFVVRDSLQSLTLTDHIAAFADSVRTQISRSIGHIINDSITSAYVQAMLLGERQSLPPQSWQEFQRAGLSHILVVSGFNLSIIAAAFYYLLRLLRMRQRKLRIILSMLVAGLYALLIGAEPSMLRAAIVIVIFLVAKLTERKPDLINLTAAAACINLIINPNELFDIGFQLSYGAVFSLTILAPQLDRLFERPPLEEGVGKFMFFSSLKATTIGTAAIFFGTLPILAYHFHQVSLIGLITNILAIPLSGIITILGIILVPLSLISNWVASLYGEALQFFVRCLTFISGNASDFQYSIISVARPAFWGIMLYYFAIGYILSSPIRKVAYKKCVISAAFLLMLLLLRIPLAYSITKIDGSLTMTFFDVGQGDGILISTPNGKEYMIDVGGISVSGTTPAARSIIPFLKAEGVSSINALFITHMHADHYGGAPKLASEKYIDRIYTCGEKTTSHLAWTLDSIAMSSGIPVTTLRAGNILALDENVSLYVLNPEEAEPSAIGSRANHRSLALKLVYGKTSTLFLGDVEGVDEERLVQKYGEFLRSDIVKVAHHGSKTSSTTELIHTANPKYAVISVGKNNKFGHPSDEVIRRWFSSGATICRTDNDGAVILRSDGEHTQKVHWKN